MNLLHDYISDIVAGVEQRMSKLADDRCPRCKGAGTVTVGRDRDGEPRESVCPRCNGSGYSKE